MTAKRISIWLPSPLGDAVLSTPALRAIRQYYSKHEISYIASPTVKAFLSPCPFNDKWIETQWDNPLKMSAMLKSFSLDSCVLFKNSFSSALAVFMAGIPERIGYARDGRSLLLTEKLYPPKRSDGSFLPESMIDYYMALAGWLGCDISNRSMELATDKTDVHSMAAKLPTVFEPDKPLVLLVPGGAFGPSKLWQPERYAQTADTLIEKTGATVIISIAPIDAEIEIAEQICSASKHPLLNLADSPLTPGELKALIKEADLVIGNDTGPRHLALALGTQALTLFGPNNWNWTETGDPLDYRIRKKVHCSPCDKPVCPKPKHYCMDAISVEMVTKKAITLIQKQYCSDNE